MNAGTIGNSLRLPVTNESGTTLLDVLLAMVIFAIGMLALAQLQGNLSRSSSDANTRTVAANIAEETIEAKRAFEVVDTTTGKKAYNDIVTETKTVSRGGIDYAVNFVVQDYYFNPDRVSVQKTAPAGVTRSNFKYAELTVTWNTGQEFQIDENQSTSGRMGSGSIKVSSIIPSGPPLNNAKLAAEDEGPAGPPVTYTPGQRPDIVAIQLDTNKFKESTTPEPVVVRQDELVETWFDVITYSSNNTGSIFLRREEFASISCDCTLRASAGPGSKDGRQPTIWTGAEYAEGVEAAKQYGEGASNQQSQYCDVCCRDHHDTGPGLNSYRPLASSFSGDHKHYGRNNQGVLSVTAVGGKYTEACRLVRKDGFFRVAQDFKLEGQNAFPENYLDDQSETDDYSLYVTTVVADHFVNATTPLTPPAAGSLNFDGRDDPNPTNLPTPSLAPSQQLRSRGIYTDVESAALKENLKNCFDLVLGDRSKCEAPNAQNALELYPFFDVQLTQLGRWTETNPADPVDITNEEIDNRGYSRGMAKLAGSKAGKSKAHSGIETGNVGLISIAPVALIPPSVYSNVDLFVVAGGVATPPPVGNPIVSGTLTNAAGTGNAVASVAGFGGSTNCTRPTNTTFSCVIDPLVSATLVVSNYFKNNQNLIACSSLTTVSFTQGASLSANSTTFALPTSSVSGIVIVITKDSC